MRRIQMLQDASVAINVELRTERGEVLDRVAGDGALEEVLRSLDEEGSRCIRFVDPYGDAVFNRLQAPLLAAELRGLRSKMDAPSVEDSIEHIAELADRCASEVHRYVWFIGD